MRVTIVKVENCINNDSDWTVFSGDIIVASKQTRNLLTVHTGRFKRRDYLHVQNGEARPLQEVSDGDCVMIAMGDELRLFSEKLEPSPSASEQSIP